jgi:hypothetical protein
MHVTSAYGGREMTDGLASMATMTGGSFYSVVSRATGVMDRIALEFSHFYELGIERLPGDASYKMHRVEISVAKPNITVRTRPNIADTVGVGTPAPGTDKLLALLQQPIDVIELPMEASEYALRGDKPGTVKIILASDLGVASTRPIDWGYVVIDAGKVIANGRLQLDAAASPVAIANVVVPPGHYDVRVAAIDGDKHGGVLQFPLHAELHTAGDLQMSDLVAAPAAGNKLEPRARIVKGEKIVAMTEFYASGPQAFDGVEVKLEVATIEPSQTLAAMPVALQTAGDPNKRVAQPIINSELLDPGRYLLRTIVSKGGVELGRVTRALDIAGGR